MNRSHIVVCAELNTIKILAIRQFGREEAGLASTMTSCFGTPDMDFQIAKGNAKTETMSAAL